MIVVVDLSYHSPPSEESVRLCGIQRVPTRVDVLAHSIGGAAVEAVAGFFEGIESIYNHLK